MLGLLVQVLYLGGVFAAAGAGRTAGTSALIAALQPLLVAALAGPLLGERTSGRQQLGLVIGPSGSASWSAATSTPGRRHQGPTCCRSAPCSPHRRHACRAASAPARSLAISLALQSAVAAVVFASAAAARATSTPPAVRAFWLAIAWLVVLSGIGGYGSYLFVVRRSGATRASTLLYLTPPTTAVWAWLLFGQVPDAVAVPGIVICGVGVALALRP